MAERESQLLLHLAMRSAALVALLACAAACSNPVPPGQRRDSVMDIVPIFESNRLRSQNITYYLASMEHEDDVLAVDFDLSNGFSRMLGGVTAWVTVYGLGGESRAQQQPLGPMQPHSTRSLRIRVPDVTFAVDRVEFGVQVSP